MIRLFFSDLRYVRFRYKHAKITLQKKMRVALFEKSKNIPENYLFFEPWGSSINVVNNFFIFIYHLSFVILFVISLVVKKLLEPSPLLPHLQLRIINYKWKISIHNIFYNIIILCIKIAQLNFSSPEFSWGKLWEYPKNNLASKFLRFKIKVR